MTITIVERDEAAEAHRDHYHYTRTVEIAGRIVRATVKRDFYAEYSLAYVEMINDHQSWTHLADKPTVDWWYDTPHPRPEIAAATTLGPIAEHLIQRAVAILTPPASLVLSPRHRDAIHVLLATMPDYDGKLRLDSTTIDQADGTLRIIDSPDGSVTFMTTTQTSTARSHRPREVPTRNTSTVPSCANDLGGTR